MSAAGTELMSCSIVQPTTATVAFDSRLMNQSTPWVMTTNLNNVSPEYTVNVRPAIDLQPKEEKRMARLIRYTVVDPDPLLAEHAPMSAILLTGQRMLKGTDERGLVMELAADVSGLLPAHNAKREAVKYQDEDGDARSLKAVRISQLDVVVEVVKQY